MGFDEVNIVRHGHNAAPSLLASSLNFRPSPQEQNRQRIEAFTINPYYPDFPYPIPRAMLHPKAIHPPSSLRKRNNYLSAKLATVGRRLKKSGTRKVPKIEYEVALTSDEEDAEAFRRTQPLPPRGRLLSRLKKSAYRSGNNSSASEDQGSESSTDMEDGHVSRKARRKMRSGTPGKSKLDQSVTLEQEQQPPSKRSRTPIFQRQRRKQERKTKIKAILKKDSSSFQAPDRRVIKDAILNFDVPSDWPRVQWERQSLITKHSAMEPISTTRLMNELVQGIIHYQFVLELEKQKIDGYRRDIEDHVEKLKQLDTRVEKLNARLDSIRTERVKQMEQIASTTQKRIPLLKEAHIRQQKTTQSIECYHRSMNYVMRLKELQSKVTAAQQRQALWNTFHRLILTTMFIAFPSLICVIVALLYPLL